MFQGKRQLNAQSVIARLTMWRFFCDNSIRNAFSIFFSLFSSDSVFCSTFINDSALINYR